GAALDSSAPEGLCPRCVLATVGNIRLDDSASELSSPQQPPQSALHRPTKAGDSPEKTVASPAPDTLTDLTGTTIGRYKLLEQIGEGGFGIVYMAEQLEPVQRKVALKVIKAGMDTREVIARFEAERQALALMDHPNIAKIYDAGITDAPHPASGHPLPSDGRGAGGEGTPYLSAGRPYFVME